MKTYVNNILVYLAFVTLVTFGLFVDSGPYKTAVGGGSFLSLPGLLLTYSLPNWVALAILCTFIGKASKADATADLPSMWRESTFSGLMIAAGVIFGGTYLNHEQFLNPNQVDYLKVAIALIGACFGWGNKGEQVKTMMK